MKKNAFYFAVLILSLTFVAQANAGKLMDDTREFNKIDWGIGLSVAPQAAGFNSIYDQLGYGAEGNIGFGFDSNLELLLQIDSYEFYTQYAGVYNLEVNLIPSIRYTLNGETVRPFFVGGLGLNDNIAYLGTGLYAAAVEQQNLVMSLGAGLLFWMDGTWDIYIQARFDDVFAPKGFSYFPISLGVDFY